VPQEFNPPAHRVLMAAALGVEDAGYSINIITRALTDSELLGIFRGRQADGMILLEILADDRRPELLRDHGYPFVMVGHRADNTGLSFVDVDIDYGVQTAVEHLVGLGHHRIGFVTVNPVLGDKTYAFSSRALQAFGAACASFGLAPLSCVGGLTVGEMWLAAERLLDEHPDITALVAPQEQAAIGILKAAQARAMRIPDDLSVVATLSESMSELATPPLTTIDFPGDSLGDAAARMLLDRLDHGHTDPEQVLVRPELTVRGSTGTPRP
jgi:DNA-binding LacI/PurR family transcriptional regulator